MLKSIWGKKYESQRNSSELFFLRNYIVLRLLYGQKSASDTEGRQLSNKVDDLMMDRFKEKCGSYICNDLLGCDITTAEESVSFYDSFTSLPVMCSISSSRH